MITREIVKAMWAHAASGAACTPERLAHYADLLAEDCREQASPPQAPEGFDRPKVLPHEAIVA